MVQLVDWNSRPYDFTLDPNETRNARDLLTSEGLKEIRTYADHVAPYKEDIIPRSEGNQLGKPTSLIRDAHKVGLKVVTWTFRPENHFLPASSQIGSDKTAFGDSAAEIKAYLEAGLDVVFTDAPDIGRKAVDEFYK